MNDRAARISMLLGLAPLYVYVFVVGAVAADTAGYSDPSRLGTSVATVLVCFAVLFIGRDYIPWCWRAMRLPLLMGAAIVGQLLFWHPFWTYNGCASDVYHMLQCWSQSAILLAGWCMGCVLSWWGMRGLRERFRHEWPYHRRKQMTPGVIRLTLGLALIPLLPATFFIVGVGVDHLTSLDETWQVVIGYECASIVAVVAWILIWKSKVAWSFRCSTQTGLLGCIMLSSPLCASVGGMHSIFETVLGLAPLLALTIWFSGTALIWQTNEHALFLGHSNGGQTFSVPACPSCNYNLTGLREVHCPECGWTSTVDAIVAMELARALEAD